MVDGTQVVNRLADAILGLVGSGSIAVQPVPGADHRTRHKQALQQAQQALHNSLATLQQGCPWI